MRFYLVSLLLVCVLPLSAQQDPLCGVAIDISCPGCVPQSAGACYCKTEGTSCNCSTTAYLVTCNNNNFDYVEGNQVLAATDEAPCQVTKRCQRPGGSQSNCGTYDAQHGTCLVAENCSWVDFGPPTERRIYTQTQTLCPP